MSQQQQQHTLDDILRELELLKQKLGTFEARVDERMSRAEARLDRHDGWAETVLRMHERLGAVSQNVAVVKATLEGYQRVVDEAFDRSSRRVAENFAGLVRSEMTGVRELVAELTERLDARPCVAGREDCPVVDRKNEKSETR